jgi:hypothetical protein
MLAACVTVFLASLAGSLHCVGMCGAFVAFAVGAEGERAPSRTALQSAYHGGRLITYTILGALSGALGMAIDISGSLIGLQRAAAAAAGALMIGFGVATLLRALGVHVRRVPIPNFMRNIVMRGHEVSMKRPPIARALLIGMLTTLLPCGWLYAFAVVAAGTAHPATGALVMAAFWLGTVPALAALGAGVQTLLGPLRRHAPTITAVALIGVGMYTIGHRLTLPHVEQASLTTDPEQALDHVRTLDHHDLSCCQTEPAPGG